ncbi:MAG TPA: RidA family protein [Nocardioides sp.]|nr:RidA family protein [Nocardioides sp.]
MSATFTRHDPSDVPAPEGGYTHGLEVSHPSRWLLVSGQIPEQPDGRVPDSAEEQCRVIWGHIRAALDSAAMSVTDIVKVTTYLSNRDVAAANSRVRSEVLGDHRPALTVVVAEIFDPAWLLEIEVLAAA